MCLQLFYTIRFFELVQSVLNQIIGLQNTSKLSNNGIGSLIFFCANLVILDKMKHRKNMK